MIELKYIEKIQNPTQKQEDEENYEEFIFVQNSIIVENEVAEYEAGKIKADINKSYIGGWIIGDALPQAITIRQAKLQLLALGMLDAVEEYCKTDRAIQIEWEYASKFDRNSTILNTAATAMGMTKEQLDTFFVDASKL